MPSAWLGWDVVQWVPEHPCSSAGSWSSPALFCTAGGVHHLFQQLESFLKKKKIGEGKKRH